MQTELPKSKDWIADGFLPRGGVMFLAGASKIGKSFFALGLCRALSLGEAPFECPHLSVPLPARVLYVEDEVKERGLQERGKRVFAGVDLDLLDSNLWVLSGVPEIRFDTGDGMGLLRKAVEEVQPNVLMLDPFGRFIGGLDENNNAEMGKVLGRLDKLLKDYSKNDMSLILTHHAKKPDMSANSKFDPLSPHAMRGSSRFFANPDTIVMLDRLEDFRSKNGGRGWKVRAHFETRQSEGLDDAVFTVNERDDLRVRYAYSVGGDGKAIPKLKPEEVEKKKEPAQLKFAEG
jgi:RecA-family ATPase